MDLDELAAPTPAPGAGAALAEVIAIAAALVQMTAAISAQRGADIPGDRLDRIVADAERARGEARALGAADGRAYDAVLRAARLPAEAPGRAQALADALHGAARPPQEMATLAEAVASMAREIEERGRSSVRGDAMTARTLALTAAQVGRSIAELNLGQAG